jgi:hypothetical protein
MRHSSAPVAGSTPRKKLSVLKEPPPLRSIIVFEGLTMGLPSCAGPT